MRKIVSLICLVIIAIISIVIYSNSKVKSINVTTIPKQYNILYTEGDDGVRLKVSLLFDYHDSVYVNKDNIVKSNITCIDEMIKVEVTSIDYITDITIKEKIYYKYDFNIDINFSESNINMKDCSVNIYYVNDVTIKQKIGDINIEYCTKILDENISITKLRAITSKIENRTTLTGIMLELNCVKPLSLTGVDILSERSKACFDETIILDSFTSQTDIDEILGYSYDYHESSFSPKTKIDLNEGSNVIFIPIKNSLYLNKCPIKLSYSLGKYLNYDFYYKDYLFFQEVMYDEKVIDSLDIKEYAIC